jgi:hypothetical protein
MNMNGRSLPTISIFISSPMDVGEERKVAKEVLDKLQTEFAAWLKLAPVFYEEGVMESTDHFQRQIPLSSASRIAVFILWSRLGTPIPSDKFYRNDGTPYLSGTEYEFETAFIANQETGLPHLLTYHKTQNPSIQLNLNEPDVEKTFTDSLEQKKKVDEFVGRWFKNPDGTFKLAFNSFKDTAQFA